MSILKRAVAEKQSGAPPAARPVATKPGGKAPAGPVLEDWWLVRDDQGRVGWVLARMVDVDVPLDIAQYAEGQRFVAFFASQSSCRTETRKSPQYLCLLTEPHDGSPYDYDQIRVFTWNVRKHRYETAYREHGLDGVLPVTVTQETFDKEGTLPVFILRVQGRCRQRQRAQVQAEYAYRSARAGARGSSYATDPETAISHPATPIRVTQALPTECHRTAPQFYKIQ